MRLDLNSSEQVAMANFYIIDVELSGSGQSDS
jgi:hypothetical protein